MKKVLFFTLALAATNINAQLLVDSLGRVGIATDSPKSMLAVECTGDTSTVISCYAHNKDKGIYLHSISYDSSYNNKYGIYSQMKNHVGNQYAYAGMCLAAGNNDMNVSQKVIGMSGHAHRAQTAVGLFGGKYVGQSSFVNFAGVYGAESSMYPSFTNYSGTYAGYFNGKVRVTNGIYATVLSPSASPSPSGQNGMTVLSDRNESVTDKLSQVQAVQFLRYDPLQNTSSIRASLENLDTDNMSQEELDSIAELEAQIGPKPYLSPVQYGLDADQLKAVYPELVYEDDNGNVSINYVEMIPLLVQSINELKNEIAELKGTSPKKAKAQPTAVEESVSDIDMVRMDQNKPNPFSESTVITLNIPKESQSASIFIYDMSGKQVQSLPVSERGETNITVYASDLAAGMYIYTLVVDGKVSVTRRMIVSK